MCGSLAGFPISVLPECLLHIPQPHPTLDFIFPSFLHPPWYHHILDLIHVPLPVYQVGSTSLPLVTLRESITTIKFHTYFIPAVRQRLSASHRLIYLIPIKTLCCRQYYTFVFKVGKLRQPGIRSLSKVTQISELEHEPPPSGSGVWSLNHHISLFLGWVSFLTFGYN